MESLRSSLIAAERLVRNPAPVAREADERLNRGTSLWIGVTLVMAALSVTNVMMWRALERERARRVVAERSPRQSVRLSPLILDSVTSQLLRQANSRATSAASGPMAISPVAAASASRAPATSLDSAQLAKRLADPAARDALREQLKGTALLLYGDLLKRWHLSGAAAEPALDALADHQSRQLVDALGGRAASQAPEANAADNDTVRAALNAKQLDELRAYESTLPDRQTIAPLLNELELAQTPLPKDTAEQLINIMHDERVAVPQPTAAGVQAPGAFAQAMDQWQTDLDQRIRDRAELILSSAALARLEAFQTAQRTAASVFSSAITVASDAGTPSAGSTSN